MKKYLLSLILLLMSVSVSQSAVVSQILGTAAECDTTNQGCIVIPLQLTALCTSSCVRNTRPSFTDVTRMWGGLTSCQTSTNGGATWAGCTTQPFSSGGKENYAGTADGSVVGTARVGADCFIAKSINNGTTWVNKYTQAAEACGGVASGPTNLYCYSNGACDFVYVNGASVVKVVRSTDNGENWSLIFTGSATASTPQASSYLLNDIVTMASAGNGFRGAIGNGGSFSNTDTWASGASCWGAFILGSSTFTVCYSGAGTIYEVRNATTGAIISSPSLPGALVASNVGGVSLGYGTSTVYILTTWQPPSGSAPIGIYVSRDSGSTFSLIGLSSVLANSMREGDFWVHPLNGCLYFSAGSTPQFMKIC